MPISDTICDEPQAQQATQGDPRRPEAVIKHHPALQPVNDEDAAATKPSQLLLLGAMACGLLTVFTKVGLHGCFASSFLLMISWVSTAAVHSTVPSKYLVFVSLQVRWGGWVSVVFIASALSRADSTLDTKMTLQTCEFWQLLFRACVPLYMCGLCS